MLLVIRLQCPNLLRSLQRHVPFGRLHWRMHVRLYAGARTTAQLPLLGKLSFVLNLLSVRPRMCRPSRRRSQKHSGSPDNGFSPWSTISTA
jgi:hypothetical protein